MCQFFFGHRLCTSERHSAASPKCALLTAAFMGAKDLVRWVHKASFDIHLLLCCMLRYLDRQTYDLCIVSRERMFRICDILWLVWCPTLPTTFLLQVNYSDSMPSPFIKFQALSAAAEPMSQLLESPLWIFECTFYLPRLSQAFCPHSEVHFASIECGGRHRAVPDKNWSPWRSLLFDHWAKWLQISRNLYACTCLQRFHLAILLCAH